MGYHRVLKRGEEIKFSCIRCGRCCSTGPNVALTVYDICRISKYLGVNWRDLRGKYVIAIIADLIPIPVLRGLGEKCVFLKYENGLPTCSIYPVRPMRCRLYPFQPVSPSDPSIIMVDEKCSGVGGNGYVDPPWSVLEQYYTEVKKHYSSLFKMIFEDGIEPLESLEKLLDEVCKE